MTIHPTKEYEVGVERRILFLTLELCFSPFSGNGVLARSLVSTLACTDCIQVRAICAKPHPSANDVSADIYMTQADEGDEALEIWPVELPKHCQWKRLDRSGPWHEFATACEDPSLNFRSRIKEFKPNCVIAVDWHGMLAWESIRRSFSQDQNFLERISVFYYNFRVYSSSSWDHSNSTSQQNSEDSNESLFYKEKEQLSCHLANGIICLAEHDRDMLQCLMKEDVSMQQKSTQQTLPCSSIQIIEAAVTRKINNICILPPPLRGDIRDLAKKSLESNEDYNHHLPVEAANAINSISASKGTERVFISCMVRLSPEKAPHHFVALIKKLGGVGFLRRHRLVPLMCGAKSVGSYADQVLDDFKSLFSSGNLEDEDRWPYVVIDRFLGPNELAAVFSRTSINVHPCYYDAYGMTIVESAAFGALSIVNNGGNVGAVSLLGSRKGCIDVELEEILGTNNYDDEKLGEHDEHLSSNKYVRDLLQLLPRSCQNLKESPRLKSIAREARSRALGWDEVACSRGLIDYLNRTHAEFRH